MYDMSTGVKNNSGYRNRVGYRPAIHGFEYSDVLFKTWSHVVINDPCGESFFTCKTSRRRLCLKLMYKVNCVKGRAEEPWWWGLEEMGLKTPTFPPSYTHAHTYCPTISAAADWGLTIHRKVNKLLSGLCRGLQCPLPSHPCIEQTSKYTPSTYLSP